MFNVRVQAAEIEEEVIRLEADIAQLSAGAVQYSTVQYSTVQ